MKKLFSLLTLLLACAGIYAQPWQVSTTAGPHETQVFAKLSTNLEAPATGSFVIGAFIGDECRATASQYTDVTGAPVSTSSGAPLYVLTVKGNYNSTTDKDQPITFKLWNPSTGFEYPLTLNEAVIFDTQLHGDPISEPTITMSLNAAATYTLTLKEVEVDQNYTLSDYITVTPDGATLPENLKWELSIDNGGTTWEDPSPYASIYTENGVTKLKGVKPYAGITLHMKREGEATDLANTTFDVVQHATAIIILKPTFEVYRPKSPTENGPMIAFMQAGTSYKLDPDTSSDVVKW